MMYDVRWQMEDGGGEYEDGGNEDYGYEGTFQLTVPAPVEPMFAKGYHPAEPYNGMRQP